ncbi:MAG: methyltransferase domain-containing protein [Proteobacteria bacterium]|nr:methyltransferase domain-containing protein [Pseudomonadota bacterium]
MRTTYRSATNKQYWTDRWAGISADGAVEHLDGYPLKYAELAMTSGRGRILEAGCGAGRVLRYYHDRGHEIIGMDFIELAIEKLKQADASLRVVVGDITNLEFPDEHFRYVFAFGLYHNLEHGLDKAIAETHRVLEKGGRVCASFRADNVQTRLTDWLARVRAKRPAGRGKGLHFHKLNLTRSEFVAAFSKAGFQVEQVFPVENMPIFYKFALFRAASHKVFNENLARKEGYRLSWLGNLLQSMLMWLAPDQFCNIYVLIAQKCS